MQQPAVIGCNLPYCIYSTGTSAQVRPHPKMKQALSAPLFPCSFPSSIIVLIRPHLFANYPADAVNLDVPSTRWTVQLPACLDNLPRSIKQSSNPKIALQAARCYSPLLFLSFFRTTTFSFQFLNPGGCLLLFFTFFFCQGITLHFP